jgi:hypothetical protein
VAIATGRAVPIRYSFDHVHRRLVTRANGLVTFDDITAHLDLEQRNRDLEWPELLDARGATTYLKPEQVRRLVDRTVGMLAFVDVGPTAIVTTNPTAYALARMYAVLASHHGIPTEVFRSVGAASRWLDHFHTDNEAS